MQVRPHFTLTRHQPVEAISGRSNNESHGRCSPVLSALHCTDEWLKMRLRLVGYCVNDFNDFSPSSRHSSPLPDY